MDTASATDVRDLLDIDFAWTPRQREVLDRITAGKSNQRIADELGVSLDGAKWHMREILSKLNVETRDDAAEYWRLYNGWRPRLARALRGVAVATPLKWATAAGAVAVFGVAALAVYAALGNDDEPQAGVSPETTATATASPSATSAPAATSTAGPTVAPRNITLDTQPRAGPAETIRVLGAPPASVFPPWDGSSTVIYDIERGTAVDLGPGSQPAVFSPDETLAAWVVGSAFGQGTEAMLIDLRSGARRSLGPAGFAAFTNDGQLFVSTGSNRFVVDLVTGQRTPAEAEGYYRTRPDPYPPPSYVIDPPGPHSPDARPFTVKDAATGATLLTFEAVTAAPAGPAYVAAIAPPVNGRGNVYLIEIATGATTFVATAIPGKDNIPFSADEHSILWTDGFCGAEQGMVTLYDRQTGRLTRLDLSSAGPGVNSRYALLAPEGLIAIGSFGAAHLVDRETLAFVASIPARPDGYAGDVSWSSNYRYASHGIYGGHGGLCGSA